jgi:hypothetical protein
MNFFIFCFSDRLSDNSSNTPGKSLPQTSLTPRVNSFTVNPWKTTNHIHRTTAIFRFFLSIPTVKFDHKKISDGHCGVNPRFPSMIQLRKLNFWRCWFFFESSFSKSELGEPQKKMFFFSSHFVGERITVGCVFHHHHLRFLFFINVHIFRSQLCNKLSHREKTSRNQLRTT